MPKYPKQLQIKVNKETVQQVRSISKRQRRSMSDVVRLLIEREYHCPSVSLSSENTGDCKGTTSA